MNGKMSTTQSKQNPFFSEFERFPRLLEQLNSRWGILQICGYVLLWASLALVLGAYSGANCISINSSFNGKTAVLQFGYLIELNHAMFNVFGMPLFIFLAHSTFEAAGQGFHQLRAAKRLTKEDNSEKAFEWIRFTNKRFFRYWIYICIVFGFFCVIPAEIMSYNKNNFGWVQSAFAPQWMNVSLADLQMDKVPYAIREPLGLTNNIVINEVTKNVRITVMNGGATSSRQRKTIYPFLVVALGFQCFFFAIGFWIIGKLIFILLILFLGFKGADHGNSMRLNLKLNFSDKSKRFGLRIFDVFYDSSLGMIGIGALAFTLQCLSNSAKGTTLGVFERTPYYGHFISLALAIGLFSVVLLFPGLFFMRHAIAARNKRCRALGEQISTLQTKCDEQSDISEKNRKEMPSKNTISKENETENKIKKEIYDLETELDIAQQQTPWPAEDWWFRVLMGFIVCFLLLIPAGLLDAAGSWAKPIVDLCAHKLPLVLCQLEVLLEKMLPMIKK